MVGTRLKAARQARGLSLAQLGKATDISKSFLSLVESGKSDITAGRLLRLVRALDISVSDLLVSEEPAAPVSIVRSGVGKRLPSYGEGIEDFLLTPTSKHSMLPLLAIFEPGARNVEPAQHEGEEFVHVMAGVLHVEFDGLEPVTLEVGDSLMFPADMSHLYSNPGRLEARVLFVVTPPHF